MKNENSTQHTPGPWKFQKAQYRNAYLVVFDKFGQCAELCGSDQEANARLIASAPDLLKENEQLKKLNEKLVAQLSEVMSMAGHHVGQRTQFEIEETLRNELGSLNT